jgi:hypothetical protein
MWWADALNNRVDEASNDSDDFLERLRQIFDVGLVTSPSPPLCLRELRHAIEPRDEHRKRLMSVVGNGVHCRSKIASSEGMASTDHDDVSEISPPR